MTSKSKPTVIAVVALVVLEALTFYAYSFLLLLEGQPARHDDPTLKAWAWVLLAAMVLELFGAFCWIFWASKRPRPQ
ncbi:MAG: hypothetical protein DME21_13995 [Verrucomicrobia bacterium]|nr:MAG: hypothetical protein DME21_13995 [Verrucomicrobiota bacterium]